MIPIQQRPEPSNFRTNIRDPGTQFLAQVPNPSKRQWGENDLWRNCFNDLYREYHGICAYIGMWTPHHDATVDHYLPKSIYPQRAYDWENYRLSCEKANNNKSDLDILDPFYIQSDWFILDFPSLQVKPNQNISLIDFNLIKCTIDILRLNGEDFIQERLGWVMEYIRGLDFTYLERFAPFIAYELRRQKLENIITGMMQTSHST